MCQKRSSVIGILNDKRVRLDSCLRAAIEVLNRRGVHTVGSCCGHGRYGRTILVRNEKGEVADYLSPTIIIPRKQKFYRKLENGYYIIPELHKMREGVLVITEVGKDFLKNN